MKSPLISIILVLFLQTSALNFGVAQNKTVIPLAGNTYANKIGLSLSKTDGIVDWTDPSVSPVVYIRFLEKGIYSIGIKAKAISNAAIKVSIGDNSKTLKIRKGNWKVYQLGNFEIKDTGYTAIVLQGIHKSGNSYGIFQALEINAPADKLQYVKDDFYFGRRGPSVHLSYKVPSDRNVEWFYNEVTIPKGYDKIGSYYMANGFQEGYFGIQVNSETERRILFSVWSPFSTDDPKAIPDSMKIKLLAKGKNVYTGEFGNEGSGGQSYLVFNWKADKTYKFLTRARPTRTGSTVFTAYFFDAETQKWLLIASFERPKTNNWYAKPHSFLENFEPETGAMMRKGFYDNQWVYFAKPDNAFSTDYRTGEWAELTVAQFTYDATARKKARMDYRGGVENNQFYLQNCGFFSQFTPLNTTFERKPTRKQPVIDFERLPKE